MITIVIPCSEEDPLVDKSINDNLTIFSKYPIIVIDKKGGDRFVFLEQQGNYDIEYFAQDTSFWFARRFAYEFVKTKYTLNLDVDTVLPEGYIEQAIQLLESRPEVACVALDYAEPYQQNHLAFGTSIWRTELLIELYDWRLTADQPFGTCECKYMWKKAEAKGMKVETLPMKAVHLKGRITV